MFLEYLNAAVINKLRKCGNTIRNDILKYFEEARTILIEQLSTARSKIHLAFDLWTSPNYKAMLAVTGHWTSSNYTAESTLLGLQEVKGMHEGANIGGVVFDIVKDFGI